MTSSYGRGWTDGKNLSEQRERKWTAREQPQRVVEARSRTQRRRLSVERAGERRRGEPNGSPRAVMIAVAVAVVIVCVLVRAASPRSSRGSSHDPRCARTRGRPRVRAYGSQRPPARPRPLEVHQDRTRRQVSRSCVGYSKPVVKRRLATVKSTLGVSYSSGAGVPRTASPSLDRTRRPPAGRSIASLQRRSPSVDLLRWPLAPV